MFSVCVRVVRTSRQTRIHLAKASKNKWVKKKKSSLRLYLLVKKGNDFIHQVLINVITKVIIKQKLQRKFTKFHSQNPRFPQMFLKVQRSSPRPPPERSLSPTGLPPGPPCCRIGDSSGGTSHTPRLVHRFGFPFRIYGPSHAADDFSLWIKKNMYLSS